MSTWTQPTRRAGGDRGALRRGVAGVLVLEPLQRRADEAQGLPGPCTARQTGWTMVPTVFRHCAGFRIPTQRQDSLSDTATTLFLRKKQRLLSC